MRRPRARFTVRWMMVAVAIVAMGAATSGLFARREEYQRRALTHELLAYFLRRGCSNIAPQPSRASYHEELQLKYERAARFPWLAVEPDPPEPD